MDNWVIQGEKSFPLAFASPGEKLTIKSIIGGHELCSRLSALGLIPGVEVEILQENGHCSGLLVRVGESRLALGRGMAVKVMVG